MHIWAEAGACEGDIDYALDAAAEVAQAGAHALKVQWLDTRMIFSRNAVRYDNTPGPWIRQADGYPKTLKYMEWKPVAELCAELGIGFIPAIFDQTAMLAASEMGLAMVKVASGDITNEQLIKTISASGVPNLTISTGGATMDEVDRAVEWAKGFNDELSITLLGCHLAYPTDLANAHLGRIIALRQKYPEFNVGYSDHTPGIDTTPLAVCLGAQVLEKHFTLDKSLEVGDHSFAVDPYDLAEMVRLSQLTLGVIDNIEMVPTPEEQGALVGARRSLYAKVDIKKGTKLSANEMIPLRPHMWEGIDASEFDSSIGKMVHADIAKGDLIPIRLVGANSATLTVV